MDDCLAYFKTAYSLTLNICNNFWVQMWHVQNEMSKLQDMLIFVDSDLYHPLLKESLHIESTESCITSIANSNTQMKLQQYEKVLKLQLNIETTVLSILNTEIKLVRCYVIDETELELSLIHI